MSKKTFNGWKNRETWAVALWIDSDEVEQKFWVEEAESQLRVTRENCDPRIKSRESAVYSLARHLEDEFTSYSPLVAANVYSDLLNGALENVDWREIAAHLIEGLK